MSPAMIQKQTEGIQNHAEKIVKKDMSSAQNPEDGDECTVSHQCEYEQEIAGDEIAMIADGKVDGNTEQLSEKSSTIGG
jgi:hypothetical protein